MLKLKTLYTQHYKNLTENEILLFNYILDNEKYVAKMSISELSEKVHVSTSSISRFCQKIGFDGYSEFRFSVNENLNCDAINFPDLSSGNYLFDDMQQTQKLFKQTDVEKLLTHIKQANIIFCYGTGMGQKLVIKDFIRKMLILKKVVIEIEAHTELEYYSHSVTENDILMIFSLSGRVDYLLPQVALFKQKQVEVFGVSKLGQSILTDISDVNLYYQTQEFPGEIDNYVSLLPIHFLTELIILAYKKKYYIEEQINDQSNSEKMD